MTPLEAARRLLVAYPLWKADDGESSCIACEGMTEATAGGVDFVHKTDCPILALPQIVMALAAAEAVVNHAFFREDGEFERRAPGYTAALTALSRAMRGEAV